MRHVFSRLIADGRWLMAKIQTLSYFIIGYKLSAIGYPLFLFSFCWFLLFAFLFWRGRNARGDPAPLPSFHNTSFLIHVEGDPLPSDHIGSFSDHGITIQNHLIFIL